MKSGSIWFLRAVLALFCAGVLAFLLAEPHFEGRNAGATLFAIYFQDPFLFYVYLGSIPFFVGLFHAFLLLALAGKQQPFSPAAVRSVRTIRYCAIAILGFVVGAEIFILLHESDDRAGTAELGCEPLPFWRASASHNVRSSRNFANCRMERPSTNRSTAPGARRRSSVTLRWRTSGSPAC